MAGLGRALLAAKYAGHEREYEMSGTTFKMTQLVGESTESIEAAVKTALATSAGKVRGHTWLHVTDIRANLGEGGSVDRWQVAVDVAFKVED